jgi:hypothetical protein
LSTLRFKIKEVEMGKELRCEYCGKTGFKTPQALAGHIRFKHLKGVGAREAGENGTPKTEAREVPIVEEDFATLLKKFKIGGPNWLPISLKMSPIPAGPESLRTLKFF